MREWLKAKRLALKLTQNDMARRLATSLQKYNHIENGRRQVDLNLSIAVKLAKICGVTLDDVWRNEQRWLRKQKRQQT